MSKKGDAENKPHSNKRKQMRKVSSPQSILTAHPSSCQHQFTLNLIHQPYFVLQCWLRHCNIMMKTVDNLYNLCFQLNAAKAFDRVSYSRLFNVLLDNNVCPYIVRLLCYMYLNQNCCGKWNRKSSTDFCVSNGVKQGAVIFPILFERLKRNAIGCHVGPVYAGGFGYADNVALVAPSLYSLRCMIATCEEFANEYQIDFNPTKSKLNFFNPNIDHTPQRYLEWSTSFCCF